MVTHSNTEINLLLKLFWKVSFFFQPLISYLSSPWFLYENLVRESNEIINIQAKIYVNQFLKTSRTVFLKKYILDNFSELHTMFRTAGY